MKERLRTVKAVCGGIVCLIRRPRAAAHLIQHFNRGGCAGTLEGVGGLLQHSQSFSDFCRWYGQHGQWIPRYRDRYLGEDCFLMGNGPSLNKVDLPMLSRYHLIGLNKIHLLLERQPLDLTFHVSVNSLVIEQSWREFTKLRCPSFVSYYPARGHVPDEGNIHYILTDQGAAPRFSHILVEPVWEGHTVTSVALQLAFFMGFRRVFLIGVDHNFTCAGKPNEEQKLTGDDPNHFDPRYFSNQQWQLPDLEGSEVAYRMARLAFERTGGAVIDATVGGKCTVFPKLDIFRAFSECRPRNAKS